MEDLLAYQEELLQKLEKAEKNYKKTPKDRIKCTYLETRLELLEELWKEFKEGHKSIIVGVSDEERKDSYFTKDVYDKFEELYIQYKSNLKESLQPFLGSSSHQSSDLDSSTTILNIQKSIHSEIKLPTIQLPTFNGKYEEWQTFYDLFCSLIHNNKCLSSVQKLHYLKCNITGDPEALLRNFSTTDANYEEAWQQLVKRYNNKRFNCNAILRMLFAQKQIPTESAYLIKQLVDTTSTCLKSLSNIGVNTTNWDMIVNYLIVSKLDSETMKQWEQHLSANNYELPTWTQLREFLESRFRSLEMIESNKIRTAQPKPVIKPKVFHSNVCKDSKDINKNKIKCALCGDEHYIFYCKKFGELSTKERQDFVQSNKLCFNCLAPTHAVVKCRQSACCKKCGRRHHSLLHFERERSNEAEPIPTGSNASKGIVSELHCSKPNTLSDNSHKIVSNFSNNNIKPCNVLLATAKVIVQSKNGCTHVIRALLDQGSQASFVTEATVQLLNLQRVSISGWVSGVGEGQMRIKHMVSFNVKSRYNSNAYVEVKAYVLRSLTTLLPTANLSIPDWSDLEDLELADPEYTSPGKIDILLGAEIYSNILLDGVIKHPKGNLLGQKTILGWVLSGRLSRNFIQTKRSITSLHVQVKEDEILKQFWEIENEPNSINKKFTKEEEKCEEIYSTTTRRDDRGRFIVKLPFKKEDPECQYGGLREIALKRFEILERKLLRDDKLREEYKNVMDEYITLKHMIQVDPKDVDNSKAVYLPHHAVLREDKETTKVRIVFDASCKGTNNASLNDDLLIGPKLQQDLRHILMRWRTHKICIAADIIKMYRMVRVAEEDTDFQRILWRPTPEEAIQHFRLVRLTFGTACAPYLAVKSLQKLAEDEHLKFPVASHLTMNDFYMDDLLTGCDSIEEAINIYNEMNQLMNLGGFVLQKWSSNNETLLNYIGDNKRHELDLPLKVNRMVKVLGVRWNRETDTFAYNLEVSESKQPITKRQILSEIAKLYDPLGWIAPVVIIAKVIMQKLWKSGLEWDDIVDGELLTEWLKYREDLTHINSISIPRWLHYDKVSKIELHVFADASKAAYGAAVYVRVIEGERAFVSLMSAKTKVAPLEKEVSIPRLELCGAVLAAKLISEIAQVMKIPKVNLYAWTDSTIVLAWLKGGSSRWTTFVSNRVSEILNILDYEQWGHVCTDMNPADCASRGLQASELLHHSLWWSGPAWLATLNTTSWNAIDIEDTHEEERVSSLTALSHTNNDQEFLWYKFSTLSRMLNVMSYCIRFINLKLPKNERQTYFKFITVKESNDTLKRCIKQVQGVYFNKEIKLLKSQGIIPKNSKLRSLCPMLDENEILRVGGRIQQSRAEYDTQHPIIIPAKNHLGKLIILDAHKRTMHGGPQIMLNYIRSKYWIMRAKDQVKKIYRECVVCVRYSKKKGTQLMGQLPEVRLIPCKPFKSAGVDYAGPIDIRFSPGRGAKTYKGYICLFVCMVTRAVHIEAVTDMTTKGFIAAFRRFTSRRGHCQDIYSDNGTNFVGADKKLRNMFDNARSSFPSELAESLILERTTWHFIPPHAPNFGGLWEAGIRSTKIHLQKVISNTTLTYEELTTVLVQIEACLNSRPITVLSDDPNDPLPLTPGHFLIGEPIINLADENYTNSNIASLDRWRLIQKIVTDFWNRWHKEYLVNLNQRYKWNTKNTDPDIDDVVILKEDNMPPSKWLLGKIIKKHVGPDNLTRVVTVKCKNGTYKRPVSKICILPKQTDSIS